METMKFTRADEDAVQLSMDEQLYADENEDREDETPPSKEA